jgi:acyl-CoA dehydrogenase
MATAINRESADWMADVSDFVRQNLSSDKKFHLMKSFPMSAWKSMGEFGLLGTAVSREYGGQGRKALDITLASLTMARESGNLGLCLSFLIHQLVSKFIFEAFGTDNQKNSYLPDLASGKATACLAVSEPKTFAHPKHIKAVAERTDGGFALTGEKTYLTNGPIADYFVVIAVTENINEKKKFSAFIVPKNSEGLTVSTLSIPFFKPATHGGIRMERCKVPSDALIGREGSAFEDIVLRFRDLEDALMMGSVTGAVERLSFLVTDAVRKKIPVPLPSLSLDLGKLKIMLDTARIITFESAAMIDSGRGHKEKTSLNLYFRDLVKDILVQIDLIVKNTGAEPDPLFKIILDDLSASSRIGGHVAELKQIKIGSLFINPQARD